MYVKCFILHDAFVSSNGNIYTQPYIHCHENIADYIACCIQQRRVYILCIQRFGKNHASFKQHSPFIPLKTALYCCVYTLVKQQMHMSLMMFWNAYRRISNLPNIAHNYLCKTLFSVFCHAFEILKITTKYLQMYLRSQRLHQLLERYNN